MAFVKGKSGNPEGRPKGSKNKSPAVIKNKILEIISNNMETIQNDISKLKPAERLAFLEKLFKYAIPTRTANDINLNGLSDEQLEELYSKLQENLNDNE